MTNNNLVVSMDATVVWEKQVSSSQFVQQQSKESGGQDGSAVGRYSSAELAREPGHGPGKVIRSLFFFCFAVPIDFCARWPTRAPSSTKVMAKCPRLDLPHWKYQGMHKTGKRSETGWIRFNTDSRVYYKRIRLRAAQFHFSITQTCNGI